MPAILQEIDKMTTTEKVSTMEYLWNALQSHYVASMPDWHGDVLARRRAKIESGDASFMTVDEAEALIESDCHAR